MIFFNLGKKPSKNCLNLVWWKLLCALPRISWLVSSSMSWTSEVLHTTLGWLHCEWELSSYICAPLKKPLVGNLMGDELVNSWMTLPNQLDGSEVCPQKWCDLFFFIRKVHILKNIHPCLFHIQLNLFIWDSSMSMTAFVLPLALRGMKKILQPKPQQGFQMSTKLTLFSSREWYTRLGIVDF